MCIYVLIIVSQFLCTSITLTLSFFVFFFPPFSLFSSAIYTLNYFSVFLGNIMCFIEVMDTLCVRVLNKNLVKNVIIVQAPA